jgi:hypothetical protein
MKSRLIAKSRNLVCVKSLQKEAVNDAFRSVCCRSYHALCCRRRRVEVWNLPYPAVSSDTWVLIEIWPTVGDITLSAYFMDAPSRKNENLCEATKRALDRDAAALAKQQKREFTSYRQCVTVTDAIKAGYVEASN